jgi:hypothetical protein
MKIRHATKYSLSILDCILELLALLTVAGIIILFAVYWITAPEIVPIHYNIYGIADNFGSKNTLIISPIIAIVIYIGLTFLNSIPHVFNFPVKVTEQNKLILYKTASRMMRWTKLLICLLYANILLQEIRRIHNHGENLDNISLFILIACLMLCLIFYIVRMVRIGKKFSLNAGNN